MKILQVIPCFVPAWDYGGPVRVCYELSRQLVMRGHEVTVYTTDALNARSRIAEDEEMVDGIRVRRFRNLSNTMAYKHSIFASPGILHAIKGLDGFDVIHMHQYRTAQNALVNCFAQRWGVPCVLQAHGGVTTVVSKKWLAKPYDYLWGYRLLQDSAKVIALTETEAAQYRQRGLSEDKIEIVPNGMDLSGFENLPKRGEFTRKYGLGDDRRIVLYLARIHKIKGPDLLAKAFAGLCSERNDTRLVIAGPDDGYLPVLKELIKGLGIEQKVLLPGPLYGRDRLEAYVDADVYVLPSAYETFPVSVLEAWACGTPVIVTDRCGIADTVDGNAGFVVPCDKDPLCDAISRMLLDDQMRRDFGDRGKLLVRQRFDWTEIAARVERIYLSCISTRY